MMQRKVHFERAKLALLGSLLFSFVLYEALKAMGLMEPGSAIRSVVDSWVTFADSRLGLAVVMASSLATCFAIYVLSARLRSRK